MKPLKKIIVTVTYVYIITGFIIGSIDSFYPMLSPAAFKIFTIPYIVGNFAGKIILPLATIVFLTCLFSSMKSKRIKS